MAYFKIHVDNFEKGDLGEDVKKGDLLYLGSDGKYYKASASDKERSTTELKIAESDGGFLDTDVKLLAYGEFTYTDFPLVPGDKYYVSYEDGKITNVLYDSEDVDYVVRYVGTAIDENKLLFNPDQTYISDNRTRVNDIPIKADFDLDDRYVSHVNSQNLPEANKSLARENIGAIPASYVKDGKLTIESSGGLVNNNIIFSANQEEDSYISLDLSEGIKSDISEGTEAFSWGDHSLEGYLKEIDLDGYATEDWVNNNFISNTHVVNSITAGDISNWDEAYSKTHVHDNKSTLDSILQGDLDNWNEAYSKAHTHANKTILDGISSSDIEDWEEAYDKKVNAISFTGDTNKTLTVTREDGTTITASFLDNNDPQFPDDVLNTLSFNDNNDGVLRAITSLGEVIDTSLDGRYSLLGHTHSWGQITGKPTTFAPSAHTHNADDINAGVLNIARIPTGTSGSTVALGNHTHTWEQIENKPTNLETYGISDAVTLDNTGNKIGNYSASNIDGLDDLRTVVTYRGGNVLSMRRNGSYGGQFRNTTAGNNWLGRTLSNGVWSDWNRFWHDGDFSSNTISNWNQAYDWGDFRDYGLGVNPNVTDADLITESRFFSTSSSHAFGFGSGIHLGRYESSGVRAGQLHIANATTGTEPVFKVRAVYGNGFTPIREVWHSGNLTNVSQLNNDAGYITSVPDSFVTKDNISSSSLVTTVIDFDDPGNGASVLYAGFASTNFPSVSGTAGGLLIRANHSTVGEYQLYLARGEDDALLYRNQSGVWNRAASRNWVNSQGFIKDLSNYYTKNEADGRFALRTRTITGTGSLTGGGDLTDDRTIDLSTTVKSDINKGVTAHDWGDFRDYGLGTEAVIKSGLLEDNNESGFYAFATSQQGFSFPRAMLLNRGSQNYGIIFSNSRDEVGFLTGDELVHTAWHSGNLTTGTLSQLNAGTNTENRVWGAKTIADYVKQYTGDNLGLQGVTDIGNWTSNAIDFVNGSNLSFTITNGINGSPHPQAQPTVGVPSIQALNKEFLIVNSSDSFPDFSDKLPHKFGLLDNTAAWANSFSFGSDFGFRFGYLPGINGDWMSIGLDTQLHHVERLANAAYISAGGGYYYQRLHFPPENNATLATREWIEDGFMRSGRFMGVGSGQDTIGGNTTTSDAIESLNISTWHSGPGRASSTNSALVSFRPYSSGSYGGQFDLYRTGDLYYRGINNGNPTSWYRIWTSKDLRSNSENDSRYARTLTNSTTNTISGTQVRRAALTGDVTAAANSNTTTISDNVVSSNHLKDNAIVNRHINNGVVTTLKLANGSVTLEKMGSMPSKNIIGRYATTSGGPQFVSMGETMEITDSGELEVKSSFVGGLYPFVHQDHGQCITVGQDKTRYLYTGPTGDNPICIMASLNDVGKELYIINKGGTRTIDTTSGTRFSPIYTGSTNISSINSNTTFHVRVLKRSNTNEAFFLILGDFKNDGQ